MKSNQIEKIIADQKNAAKRLATALLAAATITTGAAVLTSCDDEPTLQQPSNNTNETINGELPSQQLTEELTTEEETYTHNEEELVDLICSKYPEFEYGIYGYNILTMNKGFKNQYYTIHLIRKDENNQSAGSFIDRMTINEEELNEIKEICGEHYEEYAEGSAIILNDELPEEVRNYLTTLCFDLYSQYFEENTNNLEQ